jgi:hypothetical protein
MDTDRDNLNLLENVLRDLIEKVLRKPHGDTWLAHTGLTQDRLDKWQERRDEEPKRRPGGEVDQRLLYYADFPDVVAIIQKNWAGGFKDCFHDRKRFDVYMDRLSAFRNPHAHSRELLPFEQQLVVGMTGQLRQEITVFLSTGGTGPEPELFPRIEEVRDNFGTRAVGQATDNTNVGEGTSTMVLHPGDKLAFVARAWDPEDGPIKWTVHFPTQNRILDFKGHVIEVEWTIELRDVAQSSYLYFQIASTRPYHRHTDGHDDATSMRYVIRP